MENVLCLFCMFSLNILRNFGGYKHDIHEFGLREGDF